MKPFHPDALDLITREVSLVTGISPEQQLGRGRNEDEAAARHLAMALAGDHTHLTLRTIGEYFKRDHTTVVHGIARVRDWFVLPDQRSRALARLFLQLSARIQRHLELDSDFARGRTSPPAVSSSPVPPPASPGLAAGIPPAPARESFFILHPSSFILPS